MYSMSPPFITFAVAHSDVLVPTNKDKSSPQVMNPPELLLTERYVVTYEQP